MDQYPFLADIPLSCYAKNDRGELYCIVPADPASSVTVTQWTEPEENDFAPAPGDILYESFTGEPFPVQGNISDIMPNLSVTITDSNGNVLNQYQPYLSLKDETVGMPEEDQPLLLDFTIYPVGSEEDSPALQSFDLYLPNDTADDLAVQYTKAQLPDEFFVLQMLIEQRVIPDTVFINQFRT